MEKIIQKFGNQLGVSESTQVGKQWIKAIETPAEQEHSCDLCDFKHNKDICGFIRNYILGECAADLRFDKKEVYFKSIDSFIRK